MRAFLRIGCLLALASVIGRSAAVAQESRERFTPEWIQEHCGFTVAEEFFRIHADPKVGQQATYSYEDGSHETFRIASVKSGVCIVERRQGDGPLVTATEFELSGRIERLVRRQWAGVVGGRPTECRVERIASGPRLAPVAKRTDNTSYFRFREQVGRNWPGRLETEEVYKQFEKEPFRIERVWYSDANWFNLPLRAETSVFGKLILRSELASCDDHSPPMLDWSGAIELSPEETRAVRQPCLTRIDENECYTLARERMLIDRDSLPQLRANAKVGEWAEYGDERWTLALHTTDRFVVEIASKNPEIGVITALEYELREGKNVGTLARYVGVRGNKPQYRAEYFELPDEYPTSSFRTEFASKAFGGRDFSGYRTCHLTQGPRVRSTLRHWSPETPVGRPLRIYRPHDGYVAELSACGDNGAPELDWSAWKPTRGWALPWTPNEVKRYIEVGCQWQFRIEQDKRRDWESSYAESWTIVHTDEQRYVGAVIDTGAYASPPWPRSGRDVELKIVVWGKLHAEFDALPRGWTPEVDYTVYRGTDDKLTGVFSSAYYAENGELRVRTVKYDKRWKGLAANMEEGPYPGERRKLVMYDRERR